MAGLLATYARLAWHGLVPRPRGPLVVFQGVVRSERGLLLSVRSDLRGWELPGGNARHGESDAQALLREVREETGLEVELGRRVGDYVRTGFMPHTARVFACRVRGGRLRPSAETPVVRWFDPEQLPDTLFPWYRAPIADALADLPEPVCRREHLGVDAILAGMRIDLRMRFRKEA